MIRIRSWAGKAEMEACVKLQIGKVFSNIHRLGAIARQFVVDFHGVSSSRLQGGLPTDRLLAEWELDSPRVEALFARHPAAAHGAEERIQIPVLIDPWKASEATRKLAPARQLENRHQFQQAFSRGLAVLFFLSTPKAMASTNWVLTLNRNL
jgi:predicted GNAT superfamily acetyltransferase